MISEEARLLNAFDRVATDYDRGYDHSEGEAAFNAELECFNAVCSHFRGRGLEAGVGTGRFASALGVRYGIDPSPGMLKIAKARELRCTVSRAENLPYPHGLFDGVLMAFTLCFVKEPRQAIGECRRILCPGGLFLLDMIPADSSWGEAYVHKAAQGHLLYSSARFRRTAEKVEMIECEGFKLIDSVSTLFWQPGEQYQRKPQIKAGTVEGAGFVSLLFRKRDNC